MQVSKWGNSLAVRLPKRLVEALKIKAGDEIDIVEMHENGFEVRKSDRQAEFLAQVRSFGISLPEDYSFDRNEANER